MKHGAKQTVKVSGLTVKYTETLNKIKEEHKIDIQALEKKPNL